MQLTKEQVNQIFQVANKLADVAQIVLANTCGQPPEEYYEWLDWYDLSTSVLGLMQAYTRTTYIAVAICDDDAVYVGEYATQWGAYRALQKFYGSDEPLAYVNHDQVAFESNNYIGETVAGLIKEHNE